MLVRCSQIGKTNTDSGGRKTEIPMIPKAGTETSNNAKGGSHPSPVTPAPWTLVTQSAIRAIRVSGTITGSSCLT